MGEEATRSITHVKVLSDVVQQWLCDSWVLPVTSGGMCFLDQTGSSKSQRAGSRGAFCNLSHGRQVAQVEQFTIHSGPCLPHLIPRVMPVTLVGTGKMKFDTIRLH